ncbi:hypothetical protein BgiMline_027631 [Biomphalaria glabrata]
MSEIACWGREERGSSISKRFQEKTRNDGIVPRGTQLLTGASLLTSGAGAAIPMTDAPEGRNARDANRCTEEEAGEERVKDPEVGEERVKDPEVGDEVM